MRRVSGEGGTALHLGKVVNLFVFFHCGYFVASVRCRVGGGGGVASTSYQRCHMV